MRTIKAPMFHIRIYTNTLIIIDKSWLLTQSVSPLLKSSVDTDPPSLVWWTSPLQGQLGTVKYQK